MKTNFRRMAIIINILIPHRHMGDEQRFLPWRRSSTYVTLGLPVYSLTLPFLFNVFWKPYLWQVIFLSIGNRAVNKLLQKKICRKKNPRPHGTSMQMNDMFPARSDFTQYLDDLLLSFCWIWIWALSSCHNLTATRATLEKMCKEWLHLIGPFGRWCLGPSSRLFCRAHMLPCSSMLEKVLEGPHLWSSRPVYD